MAFIQECKQHTCALAAMRRASPSFFSAQDNRSRISSGTCGCSSWQVRRLTVTLQLVDCSVSRPVRLDQLTNRPPVQLNHLNQLTN
jgi:hypothetical protein